MGTVIQDKQCGNDDRYQRWERSERADMFARYGELQVQGMSQRQAAEMLDVPGSTLQAWRAYADSLDACPAFETEMTFKHLTDASKTLFCPWHGKVQTPQLRVHFSWPVRVDEPLYVVYVGPKITKG